MVRYVVARVVVSWMAVCICADMVVVRAQAAPPKSKSSTAAKSTAKDKSFQSFLKGCEKDATTARADLIQAIRQREQAIADLDLTDDKRRQLLKVLKNDRDAVEKEQRLPDSVLSPDEILAFMEAYSEIKQKVASRLQSERNRAEKKSDADNDTEIAMLEKLEGRLKQLVDDGDELVQHSNWNGEQNFFGGGGVMRFTVTDRTGTAILGEVRQGQHRAIRVEGEIAGNKISLQITDVIKGKNGLFELQGVVVNDRIYAVANEKVGRMPPTSSEILLKLDAGKRR